VISQDQMIKLAVLVIFMMIIVITSNINGVVGDGCCYATKGQAYRYQYNSTTSYAGDTIDNAGVILEQVDTANELVGFLPSLSSSASFHTWILSYRSIDQIQADGVYGCLCWHDVMLCSVI
jgi:hypothetical protein